MITVTIPYKAVHGLLDLGDFAGAVAGLGSQWRGAGVIPSRDGHDTRTYAYLLMVCGVLTGEHGSMGSPLQEQSKDMLSKSVRLFGSDIDGAQAAKVWLGMAYIRCGDFNETTVLADSELQAKNCTLVVMVCQTKNKSVALDGLGYPQAALDTLSGVANEVQAMPSLTQGKYYLQRGVILRKLNRQDEALEDYDLAMEHCYAAKSLRYEAVVSNNMAGVYLDRNDFSRAHVLAEKAIRLFKDLGDQNHEGMAWDQNAQIFHKEVKYHQAERCSEIAVALLERGDHSDFLAEAYTTYGRTLAGIGRNAIQPLQKAAEIYERQNNPVQLQAVTAVMWDATVGIKNLARATSVAMRPVERRRIEQVLKEHHGHVSASARDMGMTPRGLQERIKLRFPDLVERCLPPRKRKHSIVKKK